MPSRRVSSWKRAPQAILWAPLARAVHSDSFEGEALAYGADGFAGYTILNRGHTLRAFSSKIFFRSSTVSESIAST